MELLLKALSLENRNYFEIEKNKLLITCLLNRKAPVTEEEITSEGRLIRIEYTLMYVNLMVLSKTYNSCSGFLQSQYDLNDNLVAKQLYSNCILLFIIII